MYNILFKNIFIKVSKIKEKDISLFLKIYNSNKEVMIENINKFKDINEYLKTNYSESFNEYLKKYHDETYTILHNPLYSDHIPDFSLSRFKKSDIHIDIEYLSKFFI